MKRTIEDYSVDELTEAILLNQNKLNFHSAKVSECQEEIARIKKLIEQKLRE